MDIIEKYILREHNIGYHIYEVSLDAHISNICRFTHFNLKNIGQIRKLLTFHAIC